MTRASKVYSAQVTADNPTVAGVEEIVATVSGVVNQYADARIRVIGTVGLFGAVGTTDWFLRVRREDLAGAVVGEASEGAIAGAVSVIGLNAGEESRGELSGATYVLTALIGGAAGTVRYAQLTVLVA